MLRNSAILVFFTYLPVLASVFHSVQFSLQFSVFHVTSVSDEFVVAFVARAFLFCGIMWFGRLRIQFCNGIVI